MPVHTALNNPFPKVIIVPTLILLAGFDKHSQISSLTFFNNNTIIYIIVGAVMVIGQAG